jgi:hypothetical protein
MTKAERERAELTAMIKGTVKPRVIDPLSPLKSPSAMGGSNVSPPNSPCKVDGMLDDDDKSLDGQTAGRATPASGSR